MTAIQARLTTEANRELSGQTELSEMLRGIKKAAEKGKDSAILWMHDDTVLPLTKMGYEIEQCDPQAKMSVKRYWLKW